MNTADPDSAAVTITADGIAFQPTADWIEANAHREGKCAHDGCAHDGVIFTADPSVAYCISHG